MGALAQGTFLVEIGMLAWIFIDNSRSPCLRRSKDKVMPNAIVVKRWGAVDFVLRSS